MQQAKTLYIIFWVLLLLSLLTFGAHLLWMYSASGKLFWENDFEELRRQQDDHNYNSIALAVEFVVILGSLLGVIFSYNPMIQDKTQMRLLSEAGDVDSISYADKRSRCMSGDRTMLKSMDRLLSKKEYDAVCEPILRNEFRARLIRDL